MVNCTHSESSTGEDSLSCKETSDKDRDIRTLLLERGMITLKLWTQGLAPSRGHRGQEARAQVASGAGAILMGGEDKVEEATGAMANMGQHGH
jgi:hypothetical protein